MSEKKEVIVLNVSVNQLERILFVIGIGFTFLGFVLGFIGGYKYKDYHTPKCKTFNQESEVK